MLNAPAYPVFLNLEGLPVLVVGGGKVALRKLAGLMEAKAAVTVVSRQFLAGFPEGAQRVQGDYQASHMLQRPWRLVFAATDDGEMNRQVQEDAARARIFCCRCDAQEESDFFNAATARAGAVTLAVSTGGGSPALAGKIRDQALLGLDPSLVLLAELCRQWRERVKAEVAGGAGRAQLLSKMAGTQMEACLRGQGEQAARRLFDSWLSQALAPASAVDHAG